MASIEQQEHYPDFVLTEADRARWDISMAIADEISARNEPHGVPNNAFVFHFARSVFMSEHETGDPSELDTSVGVEEAKVTEAQKCKYGDHPATKSLIWANGNAYIPVCDEHEKHARKVIADQNDEVDAVKLIEAAVPDDRAEEMWRELEARYPADDAGIDELHAHMGRVADLLDELFGNPDDYDVENLDEIAVPYTASLHPRDRVGKWAHKLGAVREFANKHRDRLKVEVASRVAAARLHHDVARGTALKGDVTKAHDRHGDAAARLRAHAQEERNRSGLRGARQQALKAKTISHGTALSTLAYIYSEKAARQIGPVAEQLKDGSAFAETTLNIHDRHEIVRANTEAAHKVAEYAIQHRHEIHTVLDAATKMAHAAARARGLAAADDTPAEAEDLEVAEYALEGALSD